MRQRLYQNQCPKQEISVLENGFRRYEDYINHGNKHDEIESFFIKMLPLFFKDYPQLKMLDIGAGMGRLTRQAIEIFQKSGISAQVVALEPSQSAAKRFWTIIGEFKEHVTLNKRHFLVDSHLDKECYDFILASHVCYYFEDKHAFVKQVMNSLSKNGTAFFIATSITIMQNILYQTILPRLRARGNLPRTFDSDGRMGFAEEIEYELFQQNIVFHRDVLPSHIIFSPDEMAQDLAIIEQGHDKGGPLLKAMSFLWQYPVAALLAERKSWIHLLREKIRLDLPIQLSYEDIVLTAQKPVVIINNQPEGE